VAVYDVAVYDVAVYDVAVYGGPSPFDTIVIIGERSVVDPVPTAYDVDQVQAPSFQSSNFNVDLIDPTGHSGFPSSLPVAFRVDRLFGLPIKGSNLVQQSRKHSAPQFTRQLLQSLINH
jgi:hypothetical protein